MYVHNSILNYVYGHQNVLGVVSAVAIPKFPWEYQLTITYVDTLYSAIGILLWCLSFFVVCFSSCIKLLWLLLPVTNVFWCTGHNCTWIPPQLVYQQLQVSTYPEEHSDRCCWPCHGVLGAPSVPETFSGLYQLCCGSSGEFSFSELSLQPVSMLMSYDVVFLFSGSNMEPKGSSTILVCWSMAQARGALCSGSLLLQVGESVMCHAQW